MAKKGTFVASYGFPLFVYPAMVIVIILFGFCTEWDPEQGVDDITTFDMDGKTHYSRNAIPTGSDNALSTYAMYMDATAMCALGFGFLYVFSKYYVWSGIGFNFYICGFCFIWVAICSCFINSMFEGAFIKTKINIETMVGNNLVTAAVLISFGAFYGFVSPTQIAIVCVIEPFFMKLNEHIVFHNMHVQDAGGSLVTHTFGAYFGIAVVFGMGIKQSDLRDKFRNTTYFSDMGAMIGCIALWIFWPSFNGALLYNDSRLQGRVVMNTYLAICASCVTAFATTIVGNKGKIEMIEIQNATLAGGVIIGMLSSFQIDPWAALLVGGFGGIVSVFGYGKLHPLMEKRGVTDSAGVQMLHGIPGILGTIGAALAVFADNHNYMFSYDTQWTSTEHVNRTKGQQFGFILASLCITLIIAGLAGVLTGLLMKLPCIPHVDKEDMLIDHDFWHIHDRHADPRKHHHHHHHHKKNGDVELTATRLSTSMRPDGVVISNAATTT